MENQIIELIESLKSNKRVDTFDKASTKQAIVIRLLSLLGWDIFDVDEVKPDHALKSVQVDYSLRLKNVDTVFIGVEKVDEDLSYHQKELLGGAYKEGVALSVLTNGVAWWFYLSAGEGSFDQKRFCTLEILKQPPKDAAARLVELLEKNNVSKGKSLKIAESIQLKRQRKVIEKAMTDAWSRLLTTPPEALIKLFGDSVEKLCGYKPDKEMTVSFLSERLEAVSTEEVSDLEEVGESKKPTLPPRYFEGRIISAFSFNEVNCKVDSWDGFLLKLCEELISKHDQDVEKLLWHSVDNRYYFRENPDELRLPVNIEGTNIFVETHLSTEDTVKLAYSLLKAFGYPVTDLEIKSKGK
jgi:predicted type IV restriction endonuclease